jgi:GNAT superfamily N-acetyltransferase
MTAVSIRRPVPADRQALKEMIGRCSREAIRQRFHGYRRTFPEQYLTGALGGVEEHFALVAEVAGTSIVALASCVVLADNAADIAVLVEDGYQRQGIGSTMLRMLVGYVDHRGIGTVQATVLAEQEWILQLMRVYGSCSTTLSMGVYEVTLRREKGRPAWIG